MAKASPVDMGIRLKKTLLRVIQIVVIGLIFYFLGERLISHWYQVKSYEWRIDIFYLIAATLSVIFTFFVFSSVWKIIIRSLNKEVGYAKSFRIAYLANLGRYVPGKVWQMFGMIYLAKKEGVTEEEAVTSFGLSQLFAIPSGFLSGLVLLSVHPGILDQYSSIPYLTIGVITIAGAVFLLSMMVVFVPKLMERGLNRLFMLVRRRPISLGMNKSLAAAIYGGYFLAWILYGLSFWLFLKGITVQSTPVLPMAGIFIIAYQIGYLFLLAPGGVGPREGAMAVLLTPFFGAGVPAAIAVTARLWLIVAEALSALIAIRIK
jgi:uncharacterized membrane protein YbhN (UPF0104 family)